MFNLKDLFLDTVYSYKEGKSSFSYVVNRIEEIIDNMEIPEDDKDRLLDIWMAMEIIYAVALDEGRREITDAEHQMVINALCQLEGIVKNMTTPYDEQQDKEDL